MENLTREQIEQQLAEMQQQLAILEEQATLTRGAVQMLQHLLSQFKVAQGESEGDNG